MVGNNLSQKKTTWTREAPKIQFCHSFEKSQVKTPRTSTSAAVTNERHIIVVNIYRAFSYHLYKSLMSKCCFLFLFSRLIGVL